KDADTPVLGTEVVVRNLQSSFPSLMSDRAPLELTKLFAAYLTEYPGLTLTYDGKRIDPTSVQSYRENISLGDVELPSGRRAPITITIIEWSVPTERVFQLCDGSGVSLHEVQVGPQIKAPGYNFTVYVKTDYFRELDQNGTLVLHDLNN